MNISEEPNSSLMSDSTREALEQIYANVSEVLSIAESDVQRIHGYYLETRKIDTETRTQMIIYDIVSQIRRENPWFPIELKKVYLISTAFSKAWLTVKKKPNQYRSTLTWKRKFSPEEVIREIQKRQHLLLRKVREHGMSQWYAEFAHTLNAELKKDKKDYEFPVDWKWLSKRLGSSDGRNIYSGWGFQALRLSKSVREELIRLTTGRPVFPTHEAIRNHTELREFIVSSLRVWQTEKRKWWFHTALANTIRLWNSTQESRGDKFILPVHLYNSTRQQWLAGIIWLNGSHTYIDFLVWMNIPISTWSSPNNINRLYKKYAEYLLPLLRDIINPDISPDDYYIQDNVVKITQDGLVRWFLAPHIDRVQEVYENMVIQLY